MVQNRSKLELITTTGAIVASIVLVGICPIFYRFLEAEVSPIAAIFNRLGGSSVLLISWAFIRLIIRSEPTDTKARVTAKDYGLLLNLSLLFWASQASWAWSLTHTSIAISDLLHSLIPIFVIICGWLFKDKFFTHDFLAGSGIAIFGSLLIGLEHLSTSSHAFAGDVAAMLSAIFLGIYVFIGESLCTKFSNTTILLWVCLTGTLLSLPILWIARIKWFPLSGRGWLSVCGLILVMILGQWLFLYGMKRVGASLMSVLKLLEPIISGVAAWSIFAETLSYLDIGAACIILGGVYLSISSPLKASNQ